MQLTNHLNLLLGAATLTSTTVFAAPINSSSTTPNYTIGSSINDAPTSLTGISPNPFLQQLEKSRPATSWTVEVTAQHVSDASSLGLRSTHGVNLLNLRIWNPGWKDYKVTGMNWVPPSYYECFIHYDPKGPGYNKDPLHGFTDPKTGELKVSPRRPHAKATIKNARCHESNFAQSVLRSGAVKNPKELKWIITHASGPDLLESRNFVGYNVNLDWVKLETPWRNADEVERNSGYSVLTILDPAHAGVVIPFRDLDAVHESFNKLWIPKRQYRTFTTDGIRRPLDEVRQQNKGTSGH